MSQSIVAESRSVSGVVDALCACGEKGVYGDSYIALLFLIQPLISDQSETEVRRFLRQIEAWNLLGDRLGILDRDVCGLKLEDTALLLRACELNLVAVADVHQSIDAAREIRKRRDPAAAHDGALPSAPAFFDFAAIAARVEAVVEDVSPGRPFFPAERQGGDASAHAFHSPAIQ